MRRVSASEDQVDNSDRRKLRVVISAYACEPLKGSEPGAGWNLVTRLARSHELWVVTRANNRPVIEAVQDQIPGTLHFEYHDLPRWRRIKRWPGGIYIYHYLWQLTLRRKTKAMHELHQFDLAHQLTLGSIRYPSSLRHLDVPLVIGPVGGAEETPFGLWSTFGWRGSIIEGMRWLSNRLAALDPLVRQTYRRAAHILAVTEDTRRFLRRVVDSSRVSLLPLIGIDKRVGEEPIGRPPSIDEVNVLFVARLIHWKGAVLAVRALGLARAAAPGLRLTLLGDGPEGRRIIRTINRLGLGTAIRHIGRVPTGDDVRRLYETHDIFLFPSLHDSGGMAVLEAMASGLPVVCLDIGGPGVSVTDDCGIKISEQTRRSAVTALGSALIALARNPNLRKRMGTAGRVRALSEYSWDTKARRIESIYRTVERLAQVQTPTDRGQDNGKSGSDDRQSRSHKQG